MPNDLAVWHHVVGELDACQALAANGDRNAVAAAVEAEQRLLFAAAPDLRAIELKLITLRKISQDFAISPGDLSPLISDVARQRLRQPQYGLTIS